MDGNNYSIMPFHGVHCHHKMCRCESSYNVYLIYYFLFSVLNADNESNWHWSKVFNITWKYSSWVHSLLRILRQMAVMAEMKRKKKIAWINFTWNCSRTNVRISKYWYDERTWKKLLLNRISSWINSILCQIPNKQNILPRIVCIAIKTTWWTYVYFWWSNYLLKNHKWHENIECFDKIKSNMSLSQYHFLFVLEIMKWRLNQIECVTSIECVIS